MNIAELSEKETPFYLYDTGILRNNLEKLKEASDRYNYKVHYAVKANANIPVLQMVKDYGFGVDCVSGGEIERSISAGFKGDQVVFAGVGKSDREIEIALSHNIFCFNAESFEEVKVLHDLSKKNNKVAKIALRIKPNVDARTHKYITTGLEENKFGIDFHDLPDIIEFIKGSENLDLIGIHFHIGSQITELDVFRNLCLKVNEIQKWFQSQGLSLEHLNLGGGLGVDYLNPDENHLPDYEAFFSLFDQQLDSYEGQEIHFELGRSVVAQCGSLISRVLYVKKGIATDFLILDSGMTELIRPALYQSYHKIENWSKRSKPLNNKYDVVGPICESSDYFGKAVQFPESERGDIIAIRSCGAYGEVMASSCNLRPKAEAHYV